MNKDAKIGLITLAIALSVVLFNSLREAGVVSFGSEIGLIFSQVQGLRAGDTVTIGGVPSGKVVSIDFASKETIESLAPLTGGVALVRAQVSFNDIRRIPRDSTYAVRTDLNGRRWLEITLSPSSEEIGPNEVFFAEQSRSQDDQLQTTINTFSLLGEQTEKLRDVLADPEFRLRTKDTASNLRFYSRELAAASAEAPALLKQFDKELDTQESAILRQLQAFDDNTKVVRQRMTELSPQISENLQGWTERMSRQGDRLTSTLQMAIERSDDYQAMLDRSIKENLNPEAVQALIVQTKKWGRKLEEYRYLAEDLHALTSDPTVRADLKAAIAKFEIRTVEINERLDKLEQQIDDNPLKPILGIPDSKTDGKVEGTPDPKTDPSAPSGKKKPTESPTPAAPREVEASPSDDERIFQR